jgi:hypothetical protein
MMGFFFLLCVWFWFGVFGWFIAYCGFLF